MQTMPKLSVYAAAGVMFIAALAGLYIGVGRSLGSASGLADEAGAVVPAVTPVASAKPILTPTQTMDEAEVRKLAREEAQAILAKATPHKAPVDDDTEDTSAEQLTPVTPTPPPAKPTTPAPQN